MEFVYDHTKTPEENLIYFSQKHNCAITDKLLCSLLDNSDKLAHFRDQFNIPNRKVTNDNKEKTNGK